MFFSRVGEYAPCSQLYKHMPIGKPSFDGMSLTGTNDTTAERAEQDQTARMCS